MCWFLLWAVRIYALIQRRRPLESPRLAKYARHGAPVACFMARAGRNQSGKSGLGGDVLSRWRAGEDGIGAAIAAKWG